MGGGAEVWIFLAWIWGLHLRARMAVRKREENVCITLIKCFWRQSEDRQNDYSEALIINRA